MKTYLIAAALAISNAYSTYTSISWGEDSASAFNLTIAGTGIPYLETRYWYADSTDPSTLVGPNGTIHLFEETFTSPSGLWDVNGRISIDDSHGPGVATGLYTSLQAAASFLRSPPMLARGFCVNTVGTLALGADRFEAWNGSATLLIPSMPDRFDPTGWSWVLNLASHRSQAVPDYGNSGLCLAFAAGLLLFFKPRKQKAWTS